MDAGLSRRLLRSSVLERPSASRHRMPSNAHYATGSPTSSACALTASFGRRPAGSAPAPQRQISDVLIGCGAVTLPAFRPPPCHFAPDKDKVSEWTPSGCRCVLALQRHTAIHLPLHFFYFFQSKGDERNKKNTVAGSVVLVPVGWRSVGAVSGSRCRVLFPAGFVAGAVLGCVRFS